MQANLKFCERYNYPSEVKTHFKMILDPIKPDKISSVLLIGGASRGELSYLQASKDIIIFSDYEFLLIANGRVRKEYRDELRHYYTMLQRQIRGRSPLFHIDFDYIPSRKLTKLKRTFWTYEVKKTGITIWGEDLKDQIPEVTLQNIDLKELNEALIWRLWTIFLYTPVELLTQGNIPTEKDVVFKYVLSKNVLDITTWLLPWEGYLIPSFTRRVNFIKNKYHELDCRSLFGENFPDFLELCLDGKLTMQFNIPPVIEFYTQSINYFIRALQYLVYRSLSLWVDSEEILTPILEKSDRLFRDNSYKRRIYDIALGLKYIPYLKDRLFNWYLAKKHGSILAILLTLHKTILQLIKGDKGEAQKLLNEAKEGLKTISFLPLDSDSDDFLREYFTVRKNFVHFMSQYFIWIKNHWEHIRSIENMFHYEGNF